jgi:hypothetical protein
MMTMMVVFRKALALAQSTTQLSRRWGALGKSKANQTKESGRGRCRQLEIAAKTWSWLRSCSAVISWLPKAFPCQWELLHQSFTERIEI